MDYKEIYEELDGVLWKMDAFLISIYDPFHNRPGKTETEANPLCQKICRKFADRLYHDTGDKNTVRILQLVCQFITETTLCGYFPISRGF